MDAIKKGHKFQKTCMGFPAVFIYVLFLVVPIILTVYYGFTDWDGVSSTWKMTGLKNFSKALQDEQFLYSMRFTLWYAVIVTLFCNVFGLLFAVFLHYKGTFINVYRSILFLPMLISPIAAGFVWKALFSYTGIVNKLLEAWFACDPVMFIGNANMSKLILIMFTLWQSIGFCMVIYLAGIQTVPGELYDSTAIDGATSWQQFIYVTFPFLAPSTTSCVIFMFTGAMREYPRPLVLTGGGPVGKTETLVYRLIKVGFDSNQLGYASAMAFWILLTASFISVFLSWQLRKREEFLN